MATTKSRTTKSRKSSSSKQNKSIAARTGRTIKQQPYVSAAIATGAVTAVAAAVAGAFFFRRNEEKINEMAGNLSGKIKDGISDARDAAMDGLRTAREKAAMFFDEEDSQEEIMEEALTLKQTGRKSRKPVDATASSKIKTGSVAY